MRLKSNGLHTIVSDPRFILKADAHAFILVHNALSSYQWDSLELVTGNTSSRESASPF